MKINLSFKCPDAISEGLSDAGISRKSDEYEEVYSELSGWVRYGEYLDVEYDTDTKEMRIVKAKK